MVTQFLAENILLLLLWFGLLLTTCWSLASRAQPGESCECCLNHQFESERPIV